MILCMHCLCVLGAGSVTDVNESCALSILSSLLVDSEKSPFYQSLLESGIGSDYAPTTGFVDMQHTLLLIDQRITVGMCLQMHQIHFQPELCPRLRWGSSERSPDPIFGWTGDTFWPDPTPLDAYSVSFSPPSVPQMRSIFFISKSWQLCESFGNCWQEFNLIIACLCMLCFQCFDAVD